MLIIDMRLVAELFIFIFLKCPQFFHMELWITLNNFKTDGESGIQAKDVSCAVTNLQREPELADSPSATGRGSNQIVADCDSVIRNNTGSCVNHLGADNSLKSCTLPYKVKQIDAEVHGSAQPVDFKRRPVDLDEFAECHGESQPIHVEGNMLMFVYCTSSLLIQGMWHQVLQSSWAASQPMIVDLFPKILYFPDLKLLGLCSF